jgi:hypothetical protein
VNEKFSFKCLRNNCGGLREEEINEISDLRALDEELYQSKPHVCAVEAGSGKPTIHFAASPFLLKWFCRKNSNIFPEKFGKY